MAAPSALVGEVGSNTGGNATSLSVTLPSGTGRKAFIVAVDGDVSGSISFDLDWTGRVLVSGGAVTVALVTSDDDTAFTASGVTWSGNQRGAAIGFMFPSDGDATALVIPTGSTGASASPDPPDTGTLTSGDYRIVALCGYDNGLRTVSSYPEADDNLNERDASNQAAGVGICSVGQTSITSYNPGTFGLSTGDQWAAFTIAIPADSGTPGSVSPAAVATSIAAPTPTPSGAATVSPAAVGSVAGLPTPSTEAGATTVAPATVANLIAVLSASISAGAKVSPAAIAAIAALPAATPLTVRIPGSFALTDFAAIYDGIDLPASGDITQWDDLSGNDRHLDEDISAGTNPPSVTTSYFGGAKAADFDDTNLETLEYDEGSTFYSGDIGFIIVARFHTFVGASDVILSAATGGSGSTWKHVFGTATSGAAYVCMHGDGSPGAHKTFGTPATATDFIATGYIRSSGDDDWWINKTQELDATDSGGNDLRGWRLGTRETDDRPLDGAIAYVAIIEMDGFSETDLLAARDDVGGWFGITGFGANSVSPAAIAAALGIPTPTIKVAPTLTPAAIAAALAAPTATPTVSPTVEPTVTALSLATPTPTIISPGSASPVAVGTVFGLLAPSLLAAASVSPSAAALVLGMPLPAILGGSAALPAAIDLSGSFPTPTALGEVVVTPAAADLVANLLSASLSAASSVSPSGLALVAGLPSPSPSGGVASTPGLVSVLADLLGADISAGVNAAAALIPLLGDLPTPVATSQPIATPSAVGLETSLLTPGLTVAPTVDPGVLALSVALPTALVSAAPVASPFSIGLVADLPQPVISSSGLALPASVSLPLDLPNPAALTPGGVAPATIETATDLPSPIVAAASSVTPGLIVVTVGLDTPQPTGAASSSPGSVDLTVGSSTPVVSIAGSSSPLDLALAVSVLAPGVDAPGAVSPVVIEALLGISTPTIISNLGIQPRVRRGRTKSSFSGSKASEHAGRHKSEHEGMRTYAD